MSATSKGPIQPFLPLPPVQPIDARIDARDRAGRARAVDPRFNVALEASAGTGKTRVLVDRYINLLKAGVDPANVLAMTFTRKAATEMRERIITTLRDAAARGELSPARWRELRDRTDDIAISTIDAFCLGLLREFPLEADLDPGFEIADETEVPRLIDESLDRALRICRGLAREDEHVALVFAQLGDRRARKGLAALLNRRLVAPAVLRRYLDTGRRDLDIVSTAAHATGALLDVFASMPGGLARFLGSGPAHPDFQLVAPGLRVLAESTAAGRGVDPIVVQSIYARVLDYFLTQEREPRKKCQFKKTLFTSDTTWAAHGALIVDHGEAVRQAALRYKRDLNVLVSRGVLRMYQVAEKEYRRTLDAHAVLDFSDLLRKTLDLLGHMEEFSQSRYRLESRYHHVLVDEFQDTSRAQWELVSRLVQSWGEGAGLASSGPLAPSIFIVGDRKQSIYGFRDADASILDDARRYIEGLRPDRDVKRSISRSFRAAPGLLAFVNDVSRDIQKVAGRRDAFRYDEEDVFPLDGTATEVHGDTPLGLIAADSAEGCADAAAGEIARLLQDGVTIRDKNTGMRRTITPADIAILFRTRDSHREFEDALERRGIAAYVYKGLGFFDADEIKDVLALLWYLADPLSDLRAAAILRSRVVGLSDEALRRLAPGLAASLRATEPPRAELGAPDAAALAHARDWFSRWRELVDRMPPAELLDLVLAESAYFIELRGPRFRQARENVKKIRALIRRIQNRGYATLGRIAAHLDRLAVGDESNASIDALDAVNLMTVHASKGLEFPVVFVVNLARGTGNFRDPIRVSAGARDDDVSVAVGDFRSDADEDAAGKDREETKRLLYVALTRARDRLYLGSVLKEGTLTPGRGSLADVMPPTLLNQFAMTNADAEWRAASGAVHRLRVVRPSASSGRPEPVEGRDPGSGIGDPEVRGSVVPQDGCSSDPASLIPDPGTLVDRSMPRVTVDSTIADRGARAISDQSTPASDRLIGTLVHRLLQRVGFATAESSDGMRDLAVRLLRSDEFDDAAEIDRLVDAAIAIHASICAREDVRRLYSSGRRYHEVPFTMATDRQVLHGTVDCLVETAPRCFTVLEFKSGRPRPEHQAQVAMYLQAMREVFPGASIDAKVIYGEGRAERG